MKKIKLLPSIIMLALCLAVLGIGVYSATTGSNTITGTLTVNSAGYEVEITVYKNSVTAGNIIGATTTSRAGADIELSDLEFNSDEANTLGEVDLIDIIVAVTNKSDSPVGVYFWDGTGDYTSGVNESFISANHVLYGHKSIDGIKSGGGTAAGVVDSEYSFYHNIPAKSGLMTYTEYMHVYLRLMDLYSEQVTVDLSLNLNVEKYEANFTTSDLDGNNCAYDYSAHTFVKMACQGMTGAVTTFYFGSDDGTDVNSTITHIVMPYGCTTITDAGTKATFTTCANIEVISIPVTVTSLGGGYEFAGCTSLTSMVLPHTITALGDSTLTSTGITYLFVPLGVQRIDNLYLNSLVMVNFAQTTWYEKGEGSGQLVQGLSDSQVAASYINDMYGSIYNYNYWA